MKSFKLLLIVCFAVTAICGTLCDEVSAAGPEPRDQQIEAGGGGVSPYPQYKWIYLYTVKTSRLQINNANEAGSNIINVVLLLLPTIGPIMAGAGALTSVKQYINQGNTNVYMVIRKFCTHDYKYFYEEVDLYSDPGYSHYLGCYYSSLKNY